MPVSPEEALEAQEAQKAADAKASMDRGDDFEPSEDDDVEETVSAKRDEDGATDEPEVKAAAPKADEVDEDSEDDEPDQRKPVLIPKHRYDSQAARTRAAEAEIEKLKQQLEERATKPEADSSKEQEDFDAKMAALDEKIADAISDGDKDTVKKLMAESRKAQGEYYSKEASSRAENQTREELQRDKLMQTIQMLEETYDEFDPEHEKHNPELVREVLDLQEGFVATGKYTPSDAMLRAVGYVMKGADPETTAEEKPKKRTRTKENIKDAKQQPPDLADAGTDSTAAGQQGEDLNVSKLSMEEFDALPDTTKKRLRGDFV